jgi:hypothetical protein
MPAGSDTAFLIDTVGEPLAKGVAATVAAQPDDPVEFLAQWLLRCVGSSGAAPLHALLPPCLACCAKMEAHP